MTLTVIMAVNAIVGLLNMKVLRRLIEHFDILSKTVFDQKNRNDD